MSSKSVKNRRALQQLQRHIIHTQFTHYPHTIHTLTSWEQWRGSWQRNDAQQGAPRNQVEHVGPGFGAVAHLGLKVLGQLVGRKIVQAGTGNRCETSQVWGLGLGGCKSRMFVPYWS